MKIIFDQINLFLCGYLQNAQENFKISLSREPLFFDNMKAKKELINKFNNKYWLQTQKNYDFKPEKFTNSSVVVE